MTEFLRPVTELLILLPGMLLACLPMKQHLHMRPGRLAAAIALLAFLPFLGGGLCYAFSIHTIWMFFPVAALAGLLYVRMVQVTYWKSVSVFLAVCGAFSCLGHVANALDLIFFPGNTAPWLSLPVAFLYNLLCWVLVGISWHPATHAARVLLEDENLAQTWYVFWVLPLSFIGLDLFLIPAHPEILHQGRMMQGYIVISLALLLLLLLFYIMFYLMAASLNRNHRLNQENHFLSMQQKQYDNLCAAIEETREMRHDLRHHFDTLLSFCRRKEWGLLEKYLTDVRGGLPNSDLNLCENTAVDGIASHYGLLYRSHEIPFSFALDLPGELPVPETDLCIVLSNLLENALEASLKTGTERQHVRAEAYLHSGHMVLLTVENAFDGTVKEKDGVFQSSKRKGAGIGIQSIRRIAEKNGGYCRFLYGDGIFCANVMLRA